MKLAELPDEISGYMRDVRSGEYAVCKEQLQLVDYIERCFETEDLAVDVDKLQRYMELQKYFPFELFPWERFLFALNAVVTDSAGMLRWPEMLIYVGRGAGKNGFLGFLALAYMTPIHGVKAYDIDICATSEDQARTTFDDLHDLMEDNEARMEKAFSWNLETISNLKTRSRLRFRTSNAKTKDGGRPGMVVFDEIHAYEDYDLINVMTTGLGKKPNPRRIYITTDGAVRDGPLDHTLERARAILRGEQADNGLLPFLCKLDDKDEVNDPDKWHKANPSLRYLPTLQREMVREFADYKMDKIGNSSFIVKRMNIPIGDVEAEVTSWDNVLAASAQELPPELEGAACVAGLDYARTTDFVAAGLLFDLGGRWYWKTHTWVCKACNDLGRIKFPLAEAAERGLITWVDENEIPASLPADWIAQQSRHHSILGLAIDDYRFSLVKAALADVGFIADRKDWGNVKLVRPSDIMRTAPIITSRFNKQEIGIGDNPLMRWYINNTKQVLDSRGNVTYDKIEPKSRKNDGFMAFVAAATLADQLTSYGSTIGAGAFDVITY